MIDELIRQRRITESRKVESEHKRLQEDLKNWAIECGYPNSRQELPDGSKPDVLRYDSKNKMCFIGDAKDATNETPSNTETVKRIKNYIQQFAVLLDEQKIHDGNIAIATNDEQAAKDWVIALKYFCDQVGITDANSAQPNVAVKKTPEEEYLDYIVVISQQA